MPIKSAPRPRSGSLDASHHRRRQTAGVRRRDADERARESAAFQHVTVGPALALSEEGGYPAVVDEMGELLHIDFAQHAVKEPWRTFGAFGLVGESRAMRHLFELVQKVAPTDAAVLLTGETGVGKEGLARAVHLLSPRKARPFVALNCSALPESLIESQLFGHVRGAFTGANRASAGLFQEAHGGTIFLDEVGEMPVHLQPKLLRVLEEKELLPLGSTTTRRVDVRVIAATNQDLEDHSVTGHFRQDLYYRLAAMHLRVPPLRERLGDIPALTTFLIRRQNLAKGYAYRGIERQALTSLARHAWPGNVRELDNVLERAMIVGNGVSVELEDLDTRFFSAAAATSAENTENLKVALGSFERQHIDRVLARAGGDKALCARLLGISRSSLFEKLAKWRIGQTRRTDRPRKSAHLKNPEAPSCCGRERARLGSGEALLDPEAH